MNSENCFKFEKEEREGGGGAGRSCFGCVTDAKNAAGGIVAGEISSAEYKMKAGTGQCYSHQSHTAHTRHEDFREFLYIL